MNAVTLALGTASTSVVHIVVTLLMQMLTLLSTLLHGGM